MNFLLCAWLGWGGGALLVVGLWLLWKALTGPEKSRSDFQDLVPDTAGATRLAVSRGPGLVRRFKRLVLGLAFAAVGLLALSLTMALRACQVFVTTTTVAEVSCAWTGPKAFNLTLTRVDAGRRRAPQTFRLAGDQWTISGGIVKWHPWLTALGVPSYHKLSRLSGGFLNAAQERAQPPTVVELDGGLGRAWWWLYRLDPYLPFIDAAYGSAAFVPVDPAYRYEVAVSPSGYLIRRVKRNS